MSRVKKCLFHIWRQKEAYRFLENEKDWTLHEKDEEAQEVIDNGKWIKLNRREEKEPELAAKNRSRVAKEMYEKCNPKGFKLLLRYIENPDQFRSEMDEYTVYRIEDMDKRCDMKSGKNIKENSTIFLS